MKKADQTRLDILNKAFELIYKNGYQATSVDKIIDTTQVTKGAFYYHFKNKQEMGVAMINEVIAPRLYRLLIAPLSESENILKTIHDTISADLLENSDFDVRYGCPINNLVQELSPLDDVFKKSLQSVLNTWKKRLIELLDYGKENRQVNEEVDSESVAEFIIVSYEGLRGTGKVYQNRNMYKTYVKQLKGFLNTLRRKETEQDR